MAAGPAAGFGDLPARPRTRTAVADPPEPASEAGDCADTPACCPRLHEAVELVGKRWTGAILAVMLQGGPMRFSAIAQAAWSAPETHERIRGYLERTVGRKR